MKKNLLALTVFAFTVIYAATAAAVPVVYLDFDDNITPDSNLTVTVGETFTANVFAQGFFEISPGLIDDHNGLVEFGIIAIDDPDAILQPLGAVVDTTFWTAPQLGSGSTTSNSVIMAGIFIPPPFQPGNLTEFPLLLGTITYEATATGVSTILMQDRDFLLDDFVAEDGFVFDTNTIIDFQGAVIKVLPVPLPGAGLLFGGGLISLLGLRRKFRR